MENNLLDQEEGFYEPPKKKRPDVVSVVCLFIVLGVISNVSRFTDGLNDFTLSETLLLPLLLLFIKVIALVGLWKMKKWGLYFYAGMIAITYFPQLFSGSIRLLPFSISSVLLILLLREYKNMD